MSKKIINIGLARHTLNRVQYREMMDVVERDDKWIPFIPDYNFKDKWLEFVVKPVKTERDRAIKAMDANLMVEVDGLVCVIPIDEINSEQFRVMIELGMKSNRHITADYTAIETVDIVTAINRSSLTDEEKQCLTKLLH